MRVLVIGGGISGLYCSLQLLKQGHKVTLIEKSDRLGGRVQTEVKDGHQFECGAGRFNIKHKHLFKLIKKYGLEDKLIKLNNNKLYIENGRKTRFTSESVLSKLRDYIKDKNISDDELKSQTPELFITRHFGKHVADKTKWAYGYSAEFEQNNLYNMLQSNAVDLNADAEYYILASGLSSVTRAMAADLMRQGCNIMLNTVATGFERAQNGSVMCVTESKYKLYADFAFFCVPKAAIQNIKSQTFQKDIRLQKSLKALAPVPLSRIYAVFPKNKNDGNVWFQGLPNITTNNVIQHIIPIRPDKGLIMITYSDGKNANTWKNAEDKEAMIMENLKLMFPNLDIPKPEWIYECFWETGVHVWTSDPVRYVYRVQYMRESRYAICGEVVSWKHHGWVEGALETAANALNGFNKV